MAETVISMFERLIVLDGGKKTTTKLGHETMVREKCGVEMGLGGGGGLEQT